MEKLKESIAKNKKIIVIISGSIIALALIIAIVLGISSSTAKDNKEELTALLNDLGKEFYENYLYDSLTENDKQNFLERISVTGMKLDLDNLSRYDGKKNEKDMKKFVNSKTGEECNKTNTYITIYANAPYEKTDYTVEVTLDCGFEK